MIFQDNVFRAKPGRLGLHFFDKDTMVTKYRCLQTKLA